MDQGGGIAQLARAFGSYPKCHWFKSSCRYQRPVGQAVKTPPFHGGNTGSSPVRVTTSRAGGSSATYGRVAQLVRALASHARGPQFESGRVHQRRVAADSSRIHFRGCVIFISRYMLTSFLFDVTPAGRKSLRCALRRFCAYYSVRVRGL